MISTARSQLGEALCVQADEVFIEHFAGVLGFRLEQKAHQRLEQRHVTVDLNLKKQIRDLRAACKHLAGALWIHEAH